MNKLSGEKSFLDHLEEFRMVIIKIAVCLIILFPVAFWVSSPAIDFLKESSFPENITLKYFSPMELFFVRMKVGLMIAFFIGLPYIAYQVWQFVVPGLYRHERFWIFYMAIISWALFLGGALFGFYFILPAVMRFALGMQTASVEPAIGVSNFIGLATMLMFGFGVMFQFPIVIFILTASGLVDVRFFKKQRMLMLILILVLAAILTPPDIISQALMAIPTYLLFELGLLFGLLAAKCKPKKIKTMPEEEEAVEPEKDNYDEIYGRK